VTAHSAFVKIKFKMVKQQWQFVCVRHHFKLKNRTSKYGWARAGNTKGGSITIPLTSFFDWFGISCMTTDNFCFYLQNRLIQTSQTGGQWYSDISPFGIPWTRDQIRLCMMCLNFIPLLKCGSCSGRVSRGSIFSNQGRSMYRSLWV